MEKTTFPINSTGTQGNIARVSRITQWAAAAAGYLIYCNRFIAGNDSAGITFKIPIITNTG